MSRRNSQRSQASPPGPSTPAWEQQQQQHHATSNNRRTSNLFAGTAPPTGQEIVNTFVLERYSRHNPTATTTTTANANTNLGSSNSSTHGRANTSLCNNNNVAQTQMSTFGGVSPSPHPLAPPSPSRRATTNNNTTTTMSTASDSRTWSVSTTSTAVAGIGGGRSFLETKEQSNWIHLSTPNHHLTLTLILSFRPQTQADLDNCRPLLLIQSGNEVLESLGLDRASVRSSKLRGVVKGSMIGFRYTSSSSFSASSSLAPAPRSSLSASHKFQIKFKTLVECSQCSSLLSSWIECQSVAPQGSSSTQLATTAITTTAVSASTSSQTLVQSSQDTDATMAPPPLLSSSPYLAQASHSNNSNVVRFDGTQPWFQHAGTGATTASPAPSLYSASSSPQSPTPTPVSISVHVGSDELAQILRSVATNSTVFPRTTPTTASMSLPPQHQHQQQQQRNRQARLSITPQFASQSMPMAMAMPVTSTSSSMAAPGLMARMSSVALSDCGVQSLQSSMGASCQLQNIETHEGSFLNNINDNSNDSTSISTTNYDDLSALLNLSNVKLQEDIDSILHDPFFQDLLLKVDQLLRGPVSKR